MRGHTASTVRQAINEGRLRSACPAVTRRKPSTIQPDRSLSQRPSLRAPAMGSLNVLVTVGTLSVLPTYAMVSPHPPCYGRCRHH